MSLFSGMLAWRTRHRLLDLVDLVAVRVQTLVWRRVRDRVATMGVHEARGYIRARTAAVIEREMEAVALECPWLKASQHDLVLCTVRQRVVRRLLVENLRRHDTGRSRRRLAA